MAMNPMEQFAIKPLVEAPLFQIGGHAIHFTNQAAMMVLVAVVASVFLSLAAKPGRLVPTRGQSLAEVSYEFVANMIHSTTGPSGLKFFPFVFTLFIFVVCCNFFGMVPGTFTVTSQIAVTFALSSLVMLVVIVTGFMKHGIGFLKLFVPHAPVYLLPLLIPIEFISFMTRPISLAVRLFANMLAGHILLVTFSVLTITLVAGPLLLKPVALVSFPMLVAFTGFEFMVSFLQAFIFALLTAVYIGGALHPHH